MKNYKTIIFKNPPSILSTFSVVGPKEASGNLSKTFDIKLSDDRYGESTYEKAECKMLTTSVKGVLKKGNVLEKDVDVLISGDLLNQIISASFCARDYEIPFLGLYNACATLAETFIVASMGISGEFIKTAVCSTVSHFSTAERQFRYPLELGSVRPPQSQWTVTGSGSFLLSRTKSGYPAITSATIGKVVDFGVVDVNNMGAAMAPSCSSSLVRHFKGTNTTPKDYDLIVTGDLGALGTKILKELVLNEGYDISANHVDCGELIFNIDQQNYQGGSGAGCSAVVLAGYLYQKLTLKKLNKILFATTGALLSTVSSGQGESIPGITHVVCLENL